MPPTGLHREAAPPASPPPPSTGAPPPSIGCIARGRDAIPACVERSCSATASARRARPCRSASPGRAIGYAPTRGSRWTDAWSETRAAITPPFEDQEPDPTVPRHRLYGLTVDSAFGLPAPTVEEGPADVTVAWGAERPVPEEPPPGEVLSHVDIGAISY